MDYYRNLICKTKRSIHECLNSQTPTSARTQSRTGRASPLDDTNYVKDGQAMNEVKLLWKANNSESCYKHVRVRRPFETRYLQRRLSPKSGSVTPVSRSGQRSPSQERRSLASSNLPSPKRPKSSMRHSHVRNIITICDMIRGPHGHVQSSESPESPSERASPRQVIDSLYRLRKDVDFALTDQAQVLKRAPAGSSEETANMIRLVAVRFALGKRAAA